MPDFSLPERIKQLEADIRQSPPAFILYRDLPFAIFRYDPADEWLLRKELRLLATRLAGAGKHVTSVSFADLLWSAIDDCEGIDALAEQEQRDGFLAAQRQVNTWLSDKVWAPLVPALAARLRPLDPQHDVAFMVRAGALGPDLYPVSALLEQLQNERLETPAVLFYPGTTDGSDMLRFLGLPHRERPGNYRVKIYA